MVLDEILAHKRAEVAARMRERPLPDLRAAAEERGRPRGGFRSALATPGVSVIAEIKQASPSRGRIAEDFEPARLARAYAEGGAAAISCLTDERYFMGHADHLRAARAAVGLPLLRKDFVLDEYQIVEAAAIGADAVLIIVAALVQSELQRLIGVAEALGLDALVEAHDVDEARAAIDAGAGVLGINNRDLRSFAMDLRTTERVLDALSYRPGVVVSESGIRDARDVTYLKGLGVQAVLIGETLMCATDPVAATRELVEAGREG